MVPSVVNSAELSATPFLGAHIARQQHGRIANLQHQQQPAHGHRLHRVPARCRLAVCRRRPDQRGRRFRPRAAQCQQRRVSGVQFVFNSLNASESLGEVGPDWQLGGFAATTPTKARAPIRIGHDETALLCGSPDVRAERLCCQPREGRAPASYPNHIDLHGPDSGRENENPARVLVAAPSL
jgi:hypothetical protein